MSIKFVLLSIFLFVIPSAGAVASKPTLVVDIDNPSFRKVVAAAPSISLLGEGISPEFKEHADQGAQAFAKLLAFSGMFRVLPLSVVKDMKPTAKAKNASKAIVGFERVDLAQWKAIGVESLTIIKIVRSGDSSRIEYRTADLVRGVRILGKSYLVRSPQDIYSTNKRYADRLLQAYTGRPGIFSTKIAFVGKRSRHAEKQIFICDIDGKNLEQVTHTNATHLSPSWDPSGKKLLFTSYESGNPDLYQIDLTTGKKIKVSGYRGINSGATYSSNGSLIAYSGSVAGDTEIFVTHPGSQRRSPLLRGHGIDVDPNFSPDGRWLVFVSGRYGNPHIFRAKLVWNKGQDQVKVVEDKRLTYAGWYNATPAFSPNSKKIAFAGYDREIDRFDLFMMNSDGSSMERLTIRSGDNESPTWSQNGQLIMFHSNRIGTSDRKGRYQLYIMNRDGTDQRMIHTGLYEAQTPKWGPFLLD